MGQSGLARKSQYGNEYETYRRKQLERHNRQVQAEAPEPRRAPKSETVLLVVGCAIVFALSLVLVSSKVSLASAQQVLQDTTSKTSRIHNYNADMGQEIDGLQSGSRLNKVAKTSGLALSNNHIRNINK